MKVLNKYNLALLFAFFTLSLFANDVKSDNEKTKDITEEFDVNSNSIVYFNHRRGNLNVQYIDGNKGRIEANVRVSGDDINDLQTILDAITIDVANTNGRIEINTANSVKSWTSSTGLFTTKHKIELSNGKRIMTKVDEISITATLFLPKVGTIILNTKYDDVMVRSCQADRLEVNIHSGTLAANDLEVDTYVKMKYGKFDLKQVSQLSVESHDSKGKFGNIGKLVMKDKYSDFKIGNILSLDAILHDANLEMGNIGEDANIIDKYSVIVFGNMQNGVWSLHDSKVSLGTAGHLTITSKYTDFVIEAADKMDIRSHDDDFELKKVKTLHVIDSKYTVYDIGQLENGIYADASHDDNFDVKMVNKSITGIELHGKYTDFSIPIPAGINYSIEAILKYGILNYPKEGLKETRVIEKDSQKEISGVAADGSSNLKIVIQGHDCKVNLKG